MTLKNVDLSFLGAFWYSRTIAIPSHVSKTTFFCRVVHQNMKSLN